LNVYNQKIDFFAFFLKRNQSKVDAKLRVEQAVEDLAINKFSP